MIYKNCVVNINFKFKYIMKKFYYLAAGIVMILVTIMACEKSSVGVDEVQTLSKEEVLLSRPADKVDVCHWDDGWVDDAYVDGELVPAHQDHDPQWITINISENALDAHLNHGDNFDGDGDGINVCNDCDDTKLPYSPEGIWTIHKLNTEYNVDGDYIVDIVSFDGSVFSGTGTRDTTGNPSGDTLYVNISGSVNGSGEMSIHMDQWFFEAKTGAPQNSFDFFGTTGECGGISEVHHSDGAVQEFWLILL